MTSRGGGPSATRRYMSNRKGTVSNVNVLVLSNTYPVPEDGTFPLRSTLKTNKTRMCSAASEKGNHESGPVSHDNVGEHMAHNKFNMNVNEAQIERQQPTWGKRERSRAVFRLETRLIFSWPHKSGCIGGCPRPHPHPHPHPPCHFVNKLRGRVSAAR